MWNKLLDILKTENGYISGSEIGQRLGVSRTAVWKNIAKLKEKGYQIEAITNKGYRLVETKTDLINEFEIKSGLETKIMGSGVYCFDTVTSTNDEARKLGSNGVAEGAVVIADTQSGGKGRRGKSWQSPRGTGIWLSLLLRPDIQPLEAPRLTLVTGLCMCKAVNEITGLKSEIKWPNDVLIGNKKICGILTEMSAEMESVNYIIVGMGLNVNMTEFDGEVADIATSLRIESGITFSRSKIIKLFLTYFEKYYLEFIKNGDFKEFADEYRKLSATLGKDVTVIGKESYEARAVDINDNGELIVENKNGERIVVFSGEVSVRNK